MPVVSRVSEDDIWLKLEGQTFEGFLDFGELGGKVAVPERMHADRLGRRGTQKRSSPSLRLVLTLPASTPDNPAEFGPRPQTRELEYRCTTADLNIVGMSAHAEHSQSLLAR